MKYPFEIETIIDVTKPPYSVDNTGKEDCTEKLRQILDDILIREVNGLQAIHDKLIEESENLKENVYIGLEAGRVQNGKLWITFPEFMPPTKIIYFPKGEYLVSDTVTYTLDNLKNFWYTLDYYENCRNIHFMGEDMDETIIRLKDNCDGYEEGANKAVISFYNNEAPVGRDREFANAAFMNYIEDITIDVGSGNPGAIGLKYLNSNIGRIKNVCLKANGGYLGIDMGFVTQGTFTDIKISGFDYGIDTTTTGMMYLDNIDLSEVKIAGIHTHDGILICDKINSGKNPTVKFREGKGRYYFINKDVTLPGDTFGNKVYFEEAKPYLRDMKIPEIEISESKDDWAFVDDFGAVGDSKTDSTRAIQRAMNSGKPYILFGHGQYLINSKIKIPKTVKLVDFLFSSLETGLRLVGGEFDSAFEVSEDSSDTLFIKNLFTFEQFRGNIRFIKHAAKRDLVLSDIQLMTASMYFNTVSGSKVYIDNCFLTCGTYNRTAWIPGDGFEPVYSHIIPYEFHGQTVYGRQVNPERADVALLNDGSDILLDGFRTEGSGIAFRGINGGRTEINLFNAAFGCKEDEEMGLFEISDSEFKITGMQAFGFEKETEFNTIFKVSKDGETTRIKWEDIGRIKSPFALIVDEYKN